RSLGVGTGGSSGNSSRKESEIPITRGRSHINPCIFSCFRGFPTRKTSDKLCSVCLLFLPSQLRLKRSSVHAPISISTFSSKSIQRGNPSAIGRDLYGSPGLDGRASTLTGPIGSQFLRITCVIWLFHRTRIILLHGGHPSRAKPGYGCLKRSGIKSPAGSLRS